MTDLEMTKLCAESMCYLRIVMADVHGRVSDNGDIVWCSVRPNDYRFRYDPLHNDEQAMALVKAFAIELQDAGPHKSKFFSWEASIGDIEAVNDNLNRAIVECVAKMQAAKENVNV